MICSHGHLRFMRLAPYFRTKQAIYFSTQNAKLSETSISLDGEPEKDPTYLGSKIRRVLQLVPQNLTAIIACNEAAKKTHGLLASSFTTITLEPKPFVSFNIKLPSNTLTSILAADGLFTASGLNKESTARVLSKPPRYAQELEKTNLQNIAEHSGKLKANWGGVWWMRCVMDKNKSVEVGDHMLVVAEVLEADHYPNVRSDDTALVYRNGKYVDVHC